MANRAMYPSQTTGIGRVYMDFELLGAGAAALTIPTDGGGAPWITSISRSGVGIYVITFKDAWTKVLFKSADADDTLNDGAYITLSNVTNEGTATPLAVTLRFRAAAGTAADPAASRRIGVSLVLRNGASNIGGQ